MRKIEIMITPPMIFEAARLTHEDMGKKEYRKHQGVKAIEYAIFARHLNGLLYAEIDKLSKTAVSNRDKR